MGQPESVGVKHANLWCVADDAGLPAPSVENADRPERRHVPTSKRLTRKSTGCH